MAKLYGLSAAQIDAAVEFGVLLPARGYYNKYGRLICMFRRSDVEARLEEVRKLPRQSERDRERARVYAARRRLSFHCPLCSREIRPEEDSGALKAYLAGALSKEEARAVAVVTHFRHAHTDYDQRRKSWERLAEDYGVLEKYRKAVEENCNEWDDGSCRRACGGASREG